MSTLYIANPRQQVEAFTYRVPDEARPGGVRAASAPRQQMIPAGQQVKLSGDLTSAQIEAILDYQRVYGLLTVEEIIGVKDFVPLIASIDKPVPERLIQETLSRNISLQNDKGRRMRREAAVTVNNQIEHTMEDKQLPGELKNFDIEVIEQRTSASETEETDPQRIRVTREGEGVTGPKGRGRQRRAA